MDESANLRSGGVMPSCRNCVNLFPAYGWTAARLTQTSSLSLRA